MKALINPNETVSHRVSFDEKKEPVFEEYPNSQRVCQVSTETFEVASPLFWVDCSDDVTDHHWYDSVNKTFNPVVHS